MEIKKSRSLFSASLLTTALRRSPRGSPERERAGEGEKNLILRAVKLNRQLTSRFHRKEEEGFFLFRRSLFLSPFSLGAKRRRTNREERRKNREGVGSKLFPPSFCFLERASRPVCALAFFLSRWIIEMSAFGCSPQLNSEVNHSFPPARKCVRIPSSLFSVDGPLRGGKRRSPSFSSPSSFSGAVFISPSDKSFDSPRSPSSSNPKKQPLFLSGLSLWRSSSTSSSLLCCCFMGALSAPPLWQQRLSSLSPFASANFHFQHRPQQRERALFAPASFPPPLREASSFLASSDSSNGGARFTFCPLPLARATGRDGGRRRASLARGSRNGRGNWRGRGESIAGDGGGGIKEEDCREGRGGGGVCRLTHSGREEEEEEEDGDHPEE